MCGCTSSSGNTRSYSLKQPEASSAKDATSKPRKMPKRIPISKQLAAIKALGKGSDLEKAVTTLVLVYNNAADAEGKLIKSEAKKLLQTQFTHFIQGQEEKPKYQEILASFDESKNEPIDFEDFMVQTLSITLMSDLLEDIKKCTKK
ncbi:sentan [Heteronotia binoei]|uniref:sentan n=1 Tax=Heteronotia binoei TaxID=13085 RepID=UPI00292CBD97|nr:sentan [Heteronotia binoei]